MTNAAILAVAGVMVAVIYATRLGLLTALRQPAVARLVWVAPRGLITVLLCLAAPRPPT